MIKKLLLIVALIAGVLSGCKKDKDAYDPEKQLQADEELIKEFIAANNIENAQRHQSGLYYVISEPGEGDAEYDANTEVEVKYALRLLDGTVIPQTTEPIKFQLGSVIAGWQIGVQLIQKGGKIRLLVPSVYAYGPGGRPGIPGNAVLDFDIELIDVKE